MKHEFFEALVRQAREDQRVWLLVGDVGYGTVEVFRDLFPQRFINAGIAEQNMLGVAAGLAMSGKVVFVYSIANFLWMRALEQIRNDVGVHNASVKLVGVGAGFSYGSLGYTHHALEDIAAARLVQNMTISCPSDANDVERWVASAVRREGPQYCRLGSTEDAEEAESLITSVPGAATVTVLYCGDVGSIARRTALMLRESGLSTNVVKVVQVWPLDETAISSLKRSSLAVTIEPHIRDGGFGSILSDAIAHQRGRPPVLRFGLRPILDRHGTREYLEEQAGMSVQRVVREVQSYIASDVNAT